jgi:DNA-binding FrmR family transcriptional regulator
MERKSSVASNQNADLGIPSHADASMPARRHVGHAASHAAAAEQIVQRLKSVEGHVRGIQKMVSDDAYCIDVLKQLKAVRAALDRVGHLALEAHLATCVADGLRDGDDAQRERVIGEILEVFDATAKR